MLINMIGFRYSTDSLDPYYVRSYYIVVIKSKIQIIENIVNYDGVV